MLGSSYIVLIAYSTKYFCIIQTTKFYDLQLYYNYVIMLLHQTFRDYKQELLLHKVDPEDNTIGHVAAANGNPKLFRVK